MRRAIGWAPVMSDGMGVWRWDNSEWVYVGWVNGPALPWYYDTQLEVST